jgi:murein DD-endopeptidase MepM/ murein hydrolase activator NlpD
MTTRPLIRPAIRLLLPALALGVLVLAPAVAGASEPVSSQPPASGTTTSFETTTPPPPTETTPSTTTTTTPTPETPATTTTESAPVSASPQPGAAVGTTPPQVRAQHAQGSTPGEHSTTTHAHTKAHGPAGGEGGQTETTEGSSLAGTRAKHRAPAPSALTPPLPLTLGSPISGVSNFFIESFQIPPFLLPIFQAAGTAYGVPWQVLAAINEVETDYGRDLSVSSAGAEGWMQFLPAEWAQYGVDANGDGFKDPYNPADAIFTAARYLKAAGGDADIRGAVFSYNHSQAYVDSVMLRAQLLGGTPSELLGAVTGLTEARFPVHAQSHFSDGFATVAASATGATETLVGTTIYAQTGAPVIAAQDGEIVGLGETPSLGRFVSLRDGYGNTYTYAQLGSVATLYPVLEPHEHTAVSARIAQSGEGSEAPPSGPATGGAQSRSPLSEDAAVSGLALGATAGLEPPTPSAPSTPAVSTPPATPPPGGTPKMFRSGPDDVYLHPLRVGVQVIEGTVLGHVGPGTSDTGAATATTESDAPHMFFQIRPAGVGAPLIDPKPILDGWVQLENTSIFRAKGENPFLGNSPTVGQVLLESKEQLEQQVLSDPGIHLPRCGRQDVQTGQIDRRVLATLEFLSVSGLRPTVSSLQCLHVAAATAANAAETSAGDAVDITAVNGVPIAGHQAPGSIADIAVRKLLTLQGTMRPSQIVSQMSYPGTGNTLALPGHDKSIHVAFAPLQGAKTAKDAHAADALGAAITPGQWIQLIARLGEIPDPKVGSGPSAASIPDDPGSSSTASPPAPAASSPSTSSPSSGALVEGSQGQETGGDR